MVSGASSGTAGRVALVAVLQACAQGCTLYRWQEHICCSREKKQMGCVCMECAQRCYYCAHVLRECAVYVDSSAHLDAGTTNNH
jgi:hypothetical protein